MYYVATRNEVGGASLVGVVGYKGPPNAEGILEIGYTVPDARRQGCAKEAARALIERSEFRV